MKNNSDYLFKVIFIGDSGVGKSSIVHRFTQNCFEDNIPSTIGVDFKIKEVEIDNKHVKLQIWDTAGQEKYKSIVPNYYRGVNAVLVVFDLTEEESLNNMTSWIKGFKAKAKSEEAEIVILGNKYDLIKTKDSYINEIKGKLEKRNLSEYLFYPVSAKTNLSIQEVFQRLTLNCIKKFGPVSALSKKRRLLSQEGEERFCC